MNEASNIVNATQTTVNTWPTFKDKTGKRFGRLVVTEYYGKSKHRVSLWKCRCVCGNETTVESGGLTSGKTRSCGCLQKEIATKNVKSPETIAAKSKSLTKHGLCKSSEYLSWCAMKARCYNPNSVQFLDYGGRGITICVSWINSFENFLHDMGKRPLPHLSIGRINNNGNYEPGNCRWETREQQANNKRNSKLLTHMGKTMTLTRWAREKNLLPATLRCRITNSGWPTDKAISTPVRISEIPAS